LIYPFQESGFGFELREFFCRVAAFDGSYITNTMAMPIHSPRVTDEFRDLGRNLLNVEVPLDQNRLAVIERERNGGDVRLRLEFELIADELIELKRIPDRAGHPAGVWGLMNHHRLYAKPEIVIPQSIWLKQILPNTGYGTIQIIELPVVPVGKSSRFKTACDALLQAQQFHAKGYYDDAVGKCRLALEPFFEDNEERKKILKRSWETRLGKATYDWLNASFLAIKNPTNKPHHSPNPHYLRLDSQMLLSVTTALVVYAIEALEESTSTVK
jgi:hypothetical protein